MENQHRIIKGYRELSQAEIDLMNKIKAHGEATRALIDEVHSHINAQFESTQPEWPQQAEDGDPYTAVRKELPAEIERKAAEHARLSQAEPHRWMRMANSKLQFGIMALTRAVAQPGTF